ncbi:MAG: DUF1353 domain-containing protein [Pseudomonadota bacterium]
MSKFLTKLVIETGDDSGAWIVAQPLIYQSDVAGRVITVPQGFPTDLASTPRIPIIYEVAGGVATMAAVVHDYLYTSGRESRAVADSVLLEAAQATGVPWWRRWTMYAGVRIGGGSHYTATPGGSPTEGGL